MNVHKKRSHASQLALWAGSIVGGTLLGVSFLANAAGPNPDLVSVISLERPDESPSTNASGIVSIKRTPTTQEFHVEVQNVISTGDYPAGGLGVFMNTSPGDTNDFQLVSVLRNLTNGAWRLDYNASPTVAPELGVDDVTNLVGRIIRVADANTNSFLETVIQPFNLSTYKASYSRHVALVSTNNGDLKASGQLAVKFNAPRGSSTIQASARGLPRGNTYCVTILASDDAVVSPCQSFTNSPSNLLSTTAKFNRNTAQGQQLFDGALAATNIIVSVQEMSGMQFQIIDAFGVVHMTATIP